MHRSLSTTDVFYSHAFMCLYVKHLFYFPFIDEKYYSFNFNYLDLFDDIMI